MYSLLRAKLYLCIHKLWPSLVVHAYVELGERTEVTCLAYTLDLLDLCRRRPIL